MQTSMALSVPFMDALKGGSRTVQIDLGPPIGRQSITVDIPPGVENGQQMLLQDAVRAKNVRVNLVVQVRQLQSAPCVCLPPLVKGAPLSEHSTCV